MKIIAVTNSQMENTVLIDVLLRIEPFIDALILRETSKTDAEVLWLIRRLQGVGFDLEKIIVHGRPDIALLTGIRLVQLPGHGLPLYNAKQQFPSLSFGRSVHSLEEAEFAYQNGADWLIYGHLYSTASKQGLEARGTEELFRMVRSIPIPIYAIGGILPDHLPLLQRNKVAGIALMSSIFGCSASEESLDSYKEKLKAD